MLVVDASVVVAALVDSGPDGEWAESQIGSAQLAAPSLMPFECANVLRRLALAGTISGEIANIAHQDLLALPIDLVGYELLADRAWELRNNASIYDAAYVSLAEVLDAPMATLDRRLAATPGVRCAFHTAPVDGPR